MMEAGNGLLDERFSGAKNINELFRMRSPAHWPEPGSDTSGHNYAVIVFRHSHKSLILCKNRRMYMIINKVLLYFHFQ